MRQTHRAEKLFIDYAGPTVPVVDRETGEIRQAQARRGGGRNYTYRSDVDGVPDGSRPTSGAQYLGGVPGRSLTT
ncbi:MAG: hypothetical protein IPI34_06155 [bacterium]|nr:hypothetical protein [bacterium]